MNIILWVETLNKFKSHSFHNTIIREYDIRGVYDETLFDKDAEILGNLFGLEVGKIKMLMLVTMEDCPRLI